MSDKKIDSTENLLTIDVSADHQLRDWAQRLGVSADVLRSAVAAVGTSATAVIEHLRESGGVVLSESGAVLGRPDLEYSAYGMVKRQSDGETTADDERVTPRQPPA